jgi:hypothetical protein
MPKVIPFRLRPNLFCRAIDLPQKAPARFIIFNEGNNPGDDGPAIFDKRAAELVMAEFKKRGVVRLTIDYDHASIKSESRVEDKRAAGWFTPDTANGNCYAGNVNWTDDAKNGIEKKEWLYISPVFTKDDDGRITSLVNLAITNNPATWGARPLIAASRGFSMDPNLAMLYACLLAVAGGADPAFTQWANDNANTLLSMAGENAATIQEAAKQYMVSEPVAASATPEEKPPVAASTTTDDTKVAASTTLDNPDEQAARSLNPVSAALLARSQMAVDTTGSVVARSAAIEQLQKEKLLPKDGATVVYARSCDDKAFVEFSTNLRANGAIIRTAGAKTPVGGKNIAAGKTAVSTEVDPMVLRTAVKQSGIDSEKIKARIIRNREAQAAKGNK